MSAVYVPSFLSDLSGSITTASVSGFSEAVDDRVAALLVEGDGVTLTFDDGAGTLTIAATGGGGGGGMTVGDPIVGGTNNRILYQDGSGNLAQALNLTFNGHAFELKCTTGYEGALYGMIKVICNYNNVAYDGLEVDNYAG